MLSPELYFGRRTDTVHDGGHSFPVQDPSAWRHDVHRQGMLYP